MDANPQNDGASRFERLAWRVFEGFGSLLGIFCSVGVLYVRYTEPARQQSWSERIASAISWEFFVALFIASCVGFIWAVAAPRWLEKLSGKTSLRVIILLLLWIVVGTLLGVR
ncbi:MAG: hypothetical protein ABSH14_16505 [Verrucomicrobiia bacterium]|jgi:membrane-bound metal-dependent hydrolase YbcI (DUF457 family)